MGLFGKAGLFDFSLPMNDDEVEAKLDRYQQLYRETLDEEESDQPHTEEEWEEWKCKNKERVDLFYELKDNVAGFVQSLEGEPPKKRRWFW